MTFSILKGNTTAIALFLALSPNVSTPPPCTGRSSSRAPFLHLPRSSFWAEPMHKCSSGFKALTWLLRASYLAVMLLAWYLALMLSRRKPLTGAVPIILSPPWVWSTIRRASNPSDIHTEATWSDQKLLLYNFAFFAQNWSVKKLERSAK